MQLLTNYRQKWFEHLSDPQNKNEITELLAYHAISNRVLTLTELLKMNLPVRLETL